MEEEGRKLKDSAKIVDSGRYQQRIVGACGTS